MAKKVDLSGTMKEAESLIASAKSVKKVAGKIARNINIDEELFRRIQIVQYKLNIKGEKQNLSTFTNLALREYLDKHYPESQEAYETLNNL